MIFHTLCFHTQWGFFACRKRHTLLTLFKSVCNISTIVIIVVNIVFYVYRRFYVSKHHHVQVPAPTLVLDCRNIRVGRRKFRKVNRFTWSLCCKWISSGVKITPNWTKTSGNLDKTQRLRFIQKHVEGVSLSFEAERATSWPGFDPVLNTTHCVFRL